MAESYSRRLEKDLYEAQATVYQCRVTLAECESSLSSSWEALNEERLQHRQCREALKFESARHQETIALLERTFKEAARSGEIADSLWHRITTMTPSPEEESGLEENTVAEQDQIFPMKQREYVSQQQLLPFPAPGPGLQQPGLVIPSETRVFAIETPDRQSPNCSNTAYILPPIVGKN